MYVPWVLIAAYLIAVLPYVARQKREIGCASVNIFIKDTLHQRMLTKEIIKRLIFSFQPNIIGQTFYEMNVERLEAFLQSQPEIKKVELYVSMSGKLLIELIPRTPIIRVYEKDNDGFYIDAEKKILPLSDDHSADVVLFTGNIDFGYARYNLSSIDSIIKNYPEKEKLFNEIYEFGKFVNKSKFWNAQFEQINLNEDNDFEIVPRVGEHIIILGDLINYEWKLKKLKGFYAYGLNSVGWDRYSVINLKYSDQIVCTKRN